MPLGDRDLLVLGVAVDPDDLHPVEQRSRDRLRDVRRRDEQHLGQIEVHVEVVIAERVVLRGIEDLEQRARRVPSPVGADLVDLVQHHHRVLRARVLQRTHDPAGQRADVGPPVSSDLGLVVHATERDANELAPEGARDGLAERRLADAGGSDQRQDRARTATARLHETALGAELPDREVLEDPVLHVSQPFVVGVEHRPSFRDVEVVIRLRGPRHVEQPVEVGADPAVLR